MTKLSPVEAIGILKKGGIVIFPTDTACGIGCGLDYPESISRLFSLRKRPKDKAMPLLVSSIEMAIPYFASPLPDNVRHLMKSRWPGALTIVYYANTEKITPLVRGGGKTIGLRMPDHPVTRKLIEGMSMPILGSSANFHREKTPFRSQDVDPRLISLADGIVEGEGRSGNISTVIDCTTTPWKIVRQGAVTILLTG